MESASKIIVCIPFTSSHRTGSMEKHLDIKDPASDHTCLYFVTHSLVRYILTFCCTCTN